MLKIDTTISLFNYEECFRKIYLKNKFYLRKKYSLLIDELCLNQIEEYEKIIN